jgi:Carbohydrate binding module (family 6)/Glycosyl hydrolases family 16
MQRRQHVEGWPSRSASHAGLAVAIAAVLVVFAVAVTARADLSTGSGSEPSWSLVWSDDFEGAAGTPPSPANWIIDSGTAYPGGPANWGTGEIQTYTDRRENVGHDGAGNLRITPVRDASGGWTSARVETLRADFKPPAGGVLRIEGRIRMPEVSGSAAAGYWPAFWALGSPYRGNHQNWPGIGELDIMENVNGVDSVWGVLHCGVSPGGPCRETSGLGASRPCPGRSCQSAFHTYRLEWDAGASPQELRWYVDGQHFHTVTQAQVGESHWAAMTAHAGYFLLLNVAMGGGFPNGVAGGATPTVATVSGVPMLVDYVAVYRSGGGGDGTAVAPPVAQPPPMVAPSALLRPPAGEGVRDAYARIEAESLQADRGVRAEGCDEGGENIGSLATGDWVRYDDVDFGSRPPVDFVVRAASGAPAGVSGLIEVRLDEPTGPLLGSVAVASTGGWQSWRTVPGNVEPVTGTHTVYLVFASGQPLEFVNVNWFHFRR